MEENNYQQSGVHHHHHHHHHHEHLDDSERFKRHTLNSAKMRKRFFNGLFMAMCVLAVIVVAAVVYVYTN